MSGTDGARGQYTVAGVLAAVLALLVVSPLMIARPCDPVGNCMPAREFLLGLSAMGFWLVTISTAVGVVV